jgi:hypothetical protein
MCCLWCCTQVLRTLQAEKHDALQLVSQWRRRAAASVGVDAGEPTAHPNTTTTREQTHALTDENQRLRSIIKSMRVEMEAAAAAVAGQGSERRDGSVEAMRTRNRMEAVLTARIERVKRSAILPSS